jgi:N utilization substance protein B
VSTQKLPADLKRAARAGARLAAVQALYQLELTGQSVQAVIRDFMEDRLGLGPEGTPVEEADPDLFRSVVEGVAAHQVAIDRAIAARLATGWKLDRIDSTSRAILRAASFELIALDRLSTPTILAEYVSLAHDFFEGAEPKFVNAILDRLARDLRAAGPAPETDPFAGV